MCAQHVLEHLAQSLRTRPRRVQQRLEHARRSRYARLDVLVNELELIDDEVERRPKLMGNDLADRGRPLHRVVDESTEADGTDGRRE